MVQGSNMTRGHTGMRKGISLVEMLIAIILFGVLAVMSFKYVKVFYDTELATKQARIGALIEQGMQLTNAYDLYSIKTGAAPTTLAILSDPTVKILTQTPTPITEINPAGTWLYSEVANLTSGGLGAVAGGSDTAYYFDLAATDDGAEYCAIINNMVDGTTSMDVTSASAFISTTYFDTGVYSSMYCVGTGALGVGPFRIIFVK